jgi:hypothetical protein
MLDDTSNDRRAEMHEQYHRGGYEQPEEEFPHGSPVRGFIKRIAVFARRRRRGLDHDK